MKAHFLYICLVILISSCKLLPSIDSSFSENHVYKLKLNPELHSVYGYEVQNLSHTEAEANSQKVTSETESSIAIHNSFEKDSAGNFVLTMTYDKIHISSTNGEQKSEMDAANASFSVNPVEKMLGVLKGTAITAVILPSGQVTQVSGYQEIGEKVMGQFRSASPAEREAVRKQWEQFIEKSLVRNHMEQLFNFFPDSAVHVGDKWKLNTTQKDAFNLQVQSTFTLKEIHGGLAEIGLIGVMESDDTPVDYIGHRVVARLKGTQQGTYKMEKESGMLMQCTTKATLEGVLETEGREIPIEIETTLHMDGKRLK